MAQLYSINSFLTFRAVPVPVRATINKAFIRFTASSAFADPNNYDTVNVMLTGHDADDSSPPTDAATADGMTRTSACINWDSLANWTDDVTYDSVDVACIVQEIVDRAGWASGNDMTLFVEEYDSTSYGGRHTTRRAFDYGTTPAKAAQLFVYYTIDEAGSGGLLVGGTATVSSGRYGTGGLVLGGTAEITGTSIEYPSGGLVLGGESTVTSGQDRFCSGGLVLGGESAVGIVYNEVGSGGLVIRSAPWLYRKLLTVPEGAIGEDFDKFYLPVATTIAGCSETVLFTTLTGDTLAHEVRQFDADTERLWAFVKLPLDADTDNDFYLYWGPN